MYTVAVSYLEWIRWVATGWFRCADRVVWVEGTDDQSGVDALLDRTPDLPVADDQGYVIARLRSEFLITSRVSGRERSVGHLWLSVAAVSSFHPLSIRGARLLEADAERAGVGLAEPVFESAWAEWRDRQIEDEAHWRGQSLCTAFGLQPPDLSGLPSNVGPILLGREKTPNDKKLRDDAFNDTRAYGWAAAMSVAVLDDSARSAVGQCNLNGAVKNELKTLKENFDTGRSLAGDDVMIGLAKEVDTTLRNCSVNCVPMATMATVFHYRNLAERSRRISLEALLEDLTVIALESCHYASLSAYCIGRSMENVAVSTLLYQSDRKCFPALAISEGGVPLNISARATALRDARIKSEEAQLIEPIANTYSSVVGAGDTRSEAVEFSFGATAVQCVGSQMQTSSDTKLKGEDIPVEPTCNDSVHLDSRIATVTDESVEPVSTSGEATVKDPLVNSPTNVDQSTNMDSLKSGEPAQTTLGFEERPDTGRTDKRGRRPQKDRSEGQTSGNRKNAAGKKS